MINKTKYPVFSWGTCDEIDFIDFMASDEPRGFSDRNITIADKMQRLQSWVKTSTARLWPDGIDTDKCYDHAIKVLNKLIAKA